MKGNKGFTGAPVIVTLGADGVLARTGSGTFLAPAPKVDAVDTTGAGDTFNGALGNKTDFTDAPILR